MVKFLIDRPIAVVMAFLAFVIIGVVTYFAIPVSLLPSIDIPRITVRIVADNTSARELENTATAPVRRQLQQVAGLSEIHSETRDGSATIRMDFDYGVDIDLAFIAVNEKIDAAMNRLPRDMQRPKAIKASATDIPVLYLNMTLKEGRENGMSFLELSQIADNTVRRRIEQLPEVAMVDVTGIPQRMLRVVPDREKTDAAGIAVSDIETALSAANYTPGSMTVREGYYEYNVNVANQLRTPDDVADLYLRHGDRIFRLGDIAEVGIVETDPQGLSQYNGKRAVTLAVIKQNDENIDKMKEALSSIISSMEKRYPEVEFAVSRNQTDLLDFTISNLVQNLVLGLILVFLITALFMGDVRTPFVIGLSIVVALVLTFLLFYLFHVSLNVVSLSGLILAVGMMIDNSVIVTENITQWRHRGAGLLDACDRGTTEMITPLLSSSLTTIAVFVPLIFMSGIAGAIFSDQAFSITAGLAMSYVVGIMLLPVLYRIFFSRRKKKGDKQEGIAERPWKETKRIDAWMARVYNKGVDMVFAHKWVWICATVAVVPLVVVFFEEMRTERMPSIDHVETMVRIEWNELLTASENAKRVDEITAKCGSRVVESSAAVGVQDYMLDDGTDLSQSEAEMYLRTESSQDVGETVKTVSRILKDSYPKASVTFYPPANIFEKIFSTSEPDVEVRLTHREKGTGASPEAYSEVKERIAASAGEPDESMALREQTDIIPDYARMALYNVDPSTVDRLLRTAFKDDAVTTLRSFSEYLPVSVSSSGKPLERMLAETMVESRKSDGKSALIPLSNLVSVKKSVDFSEINAGKNGEYLPLAYNGVERPKEVVEAIETSIGDDGWEAELTGSFFSNSKMMREMTFILLVSIVLMYFILSAQFESFSQPLIVLLEIPVDTAFALLILWLTGNTLNLMSAIGIIVTCGIVVNDSILKLDAINVLRSRGMPLLEAIHTAGTRRLRPIIMTSLTTILAMVPMLFTDDMGSQLQRPLAVAMIGSMVVGTLVSIFIIPLVYFLIYRRHDKVEKK